MAVRYVPIDNELVSAEWYSVLKDMRAAGVRFNVNEGHRTMARQWYFWNNQGRPGFNLAAYPSPFAPHIRTGRIDHAIDFSNDAAVFKWLSAHGLHPARTVRGESWHIEVPASALRAYHRGHSAPALPTLRYRSRGPSVIKAKKLLYAKGVRNFSGKRNSNRYIPFYGKYTVIAVKRFQHSHGLGQDGRVGPATWKELSK